MGDIYANTPLAFWLVKGEAIHQVSIPVTHWPMPDGTMAVVYRAFAKELGEPHRQPRNVIVGEMAIIQRPVIQANVIVARAVYNLLGTDHFDCQLDEVDLANLLEGQGASRQFIRAQILEYLDRRLDEHPDPPPTLIEILSVVHRDPKMIIEALHILAKRGRLSLEAAKLSSFPTSFDLIQSHATDEQYDIAFGMLHCAVQISPGAEEKVRLEAEEFRSGSVPFSVQGRPSIDPYKHYKILPIEADKSKNGFIFCMTEFSRDSLRRFSDVIEPLCEPEFAMPAVISKDDDLPYKIDDKVVSHIHKCSLAIADISTRNPNVMYELGFAHAINKDVIIICDSARKGDKEIFDIRNINTIFFDNDEHLRDELKKKIRAVLNATGTTTPS